jgi:hypothetical protein
MGPGIGHAPLALPPPGWFPLLEGTVYTLPGLTVSYLESIDVSVSIWDQDGSVDRLCFGGSILRGRQSKKSWITCLLVYRSRVSVRFRQLYKCY